MPKSSFAFIEERFNAFRAQDFAVKVAESKWEKNAYFRLRREVFSREQKILPDNETDAQDFKAIPIVAIATTCGMHDTVVGAVRIYCIGDDVWFGGRLCVDRQYRGVGYIGKALINEAVSRAKDLGCKQFLANVQVQNETYFKRVHWKTLEYMELEKRPHVRMEALLEHYPYMKRYLS
jgi:putative N-acetyltransferase (TIGR04045 family)